MTNVRPAMEQGPASESEAQALLRHLHELAERLEATGNYLEALRIRLREAGGEGAVALADQAAEQARLAMQEFQRVRGLIGR